MNEYSVIVLNFDFRFINLISWKDAALLLYKQNAKPFFNSEIIKKIKTVNSEFDIPNIIILSKQVKHNIKKDVPLTKKNIFIRDEDICQYTGRKLKKEERSLDHIIPLSKGGKTTWENCVTCDKAVNLQKNDKNLKDTNLSLIKKPKKPTPYSFLIKRLKTKNIAETLMSYGLI